MFKDKREEGEGKKKTAGRDNVSRFRCKSAQLESFLGSSTLKKKRERERERRNQRRILHPLRENVLKRTFALVMRRMLSPQSALGSKEAMFKRVSSFFVSPKVPVAPLGRVRAAVGGSSRSVGGLRGCADMEGGAQRNLRARFGSEAGKKKKEKREQSKIILYCN